MKKQILILIILTLAIITTPTTTEKITTKQQKPILLWTYETGDWVFSSPALGDVDGDGRLEVVVGSYDYKIYALDFPKDCDSGFRVYWSCFRGDCSHAGNLRFIDEDFDFLSSWDEEYLNTDPLDNDTDDDGLGDGEEVSAHGTDPLDDDTDDDGYPDGLEVSVGTNPLDPYDNPRMSLLKTLIIFTTIICVIVICYRRLKRLRMLKGMTKESYEV